MHASHGPRFATTDHKVPLRRNAPHRPTSMENAIPWLAVAACSHAMPNGLVVMNTGWAPATSAAAIWAVGAVTRGPNDVAHSDTSAARSCRRATWPRHARWMTTADLALALAPLRAARSARTASRSSSLQRGRKEVVARRTAGPAKNPPRPRIGCQSVAYAVQTVNFCCMQAAPSLLFARRPAKPREAHSSQTTVATACVYLS